MRRAPFYIIFCLLALNTLAQGNGGAANPPLSFTDSVSASLNAFRTEDARNVAQDFTEIWSRFGLDQQRMIRRQNTMLRQKGLRSRPIILGYFGSLVSAIKDEGIESQQLNAYLKVAEKVIEFEPADKIQEFFRASRVFFQHHALHYEKVNKLRILDDAYTFDYLEPPPPPVIEVSASKDDDDWGNDDPWDDWNNDTSWDDDVPAQQDQAPVWFMPEPQPVPVGAVIVFNRATLNMVTAYDSVFVKETKGVYSFNEKLFIGEEGTFDWTAAGLSADSVFVKLVAYNFQVNKAEISSQQVKLTYRGKLYTPVEGIFEFKSVRRDKTKPSTYPRFMSYTSDVDILGLNDANITYRGGFALEGRKIFSASVSRRPSVLEVSDGYEKKFKARSRQFQFIDSTIVATHTAITIYQGNDSITSASVQFKYDRSKQKLLLQPAKGTARNVPYSSSFFGVDFSSEVIRWHLDSDSLNIFTLGGRDTEPLIIESLDYFDPDDYRLLGGVGFGFHALALVGGYAYKFGSAYTNVDALARYARRPITEVQYAMEFLSSKGMVNYNPLTGDVIVKERAQRLFAAYRNETDYDNMKIHSVISDHANATINFKNNYMTVRGVEGFKISDSLNVLVLPDSSLITLLKNRDVKFNGGISAGNFEIRGKDFTFKYDSFFINLKHIDSIRFFVTETNAYGQKVRRLINNPMVGADSTAAAIGGFSGASQSGGTLFIAKPNNKSGKQGAGNFPKLDATMGGVIYFNRREVLNGAYNKSVYFVAPPFSLDSLSDLDVGAIRFDGTFVSSGMFPNFKEKLHTMPDKSLGFDHDVPSGGYRLYNGEGLFNGKIRLNNQGIRSAGRIDFLAASAESNDFVFYPDSVVSLGLFAEIREEQHGNMVYPQADLSNYSLKWLPKQDRMIFRNTKDPFNFYNNTAQLDGTAIVTKQGVKGTGKLITRGSEAISKDLTFNAREYSARHADFKVNTDDPDKPMLAGKDIRLRFNLDQNFADISPEIAGEAALEFPYAQFKTSIPNARWDLTGQKIVMSKSKDTPIEDSYFYTTRKDLDSLSFNAEQAVYDIKTQELKVSGIPYITVADARITPENNEVLILENARIGTLSNTVIVLDTINAYHTLVDGVINIESRKKFTGYATYRFVNAQKDTFLIKMEDFRLEPLVQDASSRKRGIKASFQTIAEGRVIQNDNLLISPGMYYKGSMTMYATKPALELDGYIKLDLRKIRNYNTWLRHSSTADQEEVIIDFDNAITEEGRRAEAGLHFAIDNSLYSTFITEKIHIEDEDFFRPSGSLFYNPESNEYVIEDLEKAAGNKLSGKVFAYNENTSDYRFEGEVKFFNPLKGFEIKASASGSGNLESGSVSMNAMVVVDMGIPTTALDIMAQELQQIVKYEGLPEGLGDRTELLYKVADLIGERAAKDYEQKSLAQYVSLGMVSAVTSKALVFADVNFKWSQERKAFYSEGELGLSNIYRQDINGAMEGFMEIRKTEDGQPVYHVFIKASPQAWYYFGFEDNRLIVHTSNEQINTVIAKRTNAAKAKMGELVFIPGSDGEVLAFVNRYRRQYYGIDIPYNLRSGGGPSTERKKKDDDDDGF